MFNNKKISCDLTKDMSTSFWERRQIFVGRSYTQYRKVRVRDEVSQGHRVQSDDQGRNPIAQNS